MDPYLLEKFQKAVRKHHLIDKGDRVLVGFSGGPDSVFLLKTLLELKDFFEIQIACFHLNHGLRGDEALRDEEFCIDFCRAYDVPIFVDRVNVKSIMKKGESLEEVSRRVRYEKFSEYAQKFGFNKVALAHTASDVVETFFINLMRGTGIWGLRGIPPKRDIFIRPLIYIYREEIEDFLKREGIPFVVDSSNFSMAFLRNAVRWKIIPMLEEIRNGATKKIRETTEIVDGVVSFLEDQIHELEQDVRKPCLPGILLIDFSRFLNYHKILRHLFLQKKLNFTFDEMEALESILAKRKQGTVSHYKLFLSEKELCFVPDFLRVPEKELTIEDFPFSCEDLNMKMEITTKPTGDKFSVGLRRENFPISLRGFRKGDRVEGVLLSERFERKGIPAWKRRIYPVFLRDKDIFWVPGVFRKDLAGEVFLTLRKVREDEYWIFNSRREDKGKNQGNCTGD